MVGAVSVGQALCLSPLKFAKNMETGRMPVPGGWAFFCRRQRRLFIPAWGNAPGKAQIKSDRAPTARFIDASNPQLYPECGYEAGRWPAINIGDRIPGALPRAGMIDAFGVAFLGLNSKCPNSRDRQDACLTGGSSPRRLSGFRAQSRRKGCRQRGSSFASGLPRQ